jgi:hypothetical protein
VFLTLASYLVAFVIFILSNLVASVAIFPFTELFRRNRALLPPARFLIDGFLTFLAVFLVSWLPSITPLHAAYAMVLLASLGQGTNAFLRLEAAKRGRSGVRRLMEQAGELDAYDQTNDVRTEWFSTAGMVLGCFLGLAFFFPGKAFF